MTRQNKAMPGNQTKRKLRRRKSGKEMLGDAEQDESSSTR